MGGDWVVSRGVRFHATGMSGAQELGVGLLNELLLADQQDTILLLGGHARREFVSSVVTSEKRFFQILTGQVNISGELF